MTIKCSKCLRCNGTGKTLLTEEICGCQTFLYHGNTLFEPPVLGSSNSKSIDLTDEEIETLRDVILLVNCFPQGPITTKTTLSLTRKLDSITNK